MRKLRRTAVSTTSCPRPPFALNCEHSTSLAFYDSVDLQTVIEHQDLHDDHDDYDDQDHIVHFDRHDDQNDHQHQDQDSATTATTRRPRRDHQEKTNAARPPRDFEDLVDHPAIARRRPDDHHETRKQETTRRPPGDCRLQGPRPTRFAPCTGGVQDGFRDIIAMCFHMFWQDSRPWPKCFPPCT